MRVRKNNLGYAAALLVATLVTLDGCKSKIPQGATAVKPFDIQRYAGKWYEIARIDIKQERGLNNTSAEYTLNDNGTVTVLNRGFDYAKKKWEEATGKAKFVDDPKEGRLKVSFFGPFFSGYNVVAIDSEYKYALIAGESLKYLWLLSRETTMPDEVKKDFLAKAKSIGYNTDDLLWVEHDNNVNGR